MNELTYSKYSASQLLHNRQPKYFCFPTNTFLNRNKAVFLFGKCYEYIKDIFPDIMQVYSKMLIDGNDSVDIIKVIQSNVILSFPTRVHWKYNTNLDLVIRSCCELYALYLDKKLIDGLKIYLPLQVDGYPNFTLDDMIEQITPILSRIPNLEIIIL